jgi:hypothetical protein
VRKESSGSSEEDPGRGRLEVGGGTGKGARGVRGKGKKEGPLPIRVCSWAAKFWIGLGCTVRNLFPSFFSSFFLFFSIFLILLYLLHK